MPKGKHKIPNYKGGENNKPSCVCGDCRICRKRRTQRDRRRGIFKWRRRVNKVEDDIELERKLIERFKEKGWD